MAGRIKARADGYLIAVIGDEDTATGFLLAGIGEKASMGSNYFVVDPKNTPTQAIEEAFKRFTTERDDVAIVLINQYIADKIRPTISKFHQAMPAILEIPSKEHPYNPAKDSILQRVRGMLGSS